MVLPAGVVTVTGVAIVVHFLDLLQAGIEQLDIFAEKRSELFVLTLAEKGMVGG
jgi:hypothetical protein